MFSIEHDPRFLYRYDSTYIYAPIKDGWYDSKAIEASKPTHYSLILVDGPPQSIGRSGFFWNLRLFRKDVPIVFDDVHRSPEMQLCRRVAEALGRPFTIHSAGHNRKFGVIPASN